MKLEEFEKKYPNEEITELDNGRKYCYDISCPHCNHDHEKPEICIDFNFNIAYFTECNSCQNIFKWTTEVVEEFNFDCEEIKE